MFARVLAEMRRRARAGNLIMKPHALEELHNDGLILDDLIQAILTGQIVERQFDELFSEYKYIVEGATLEPDELIQVVVKLWQDDLVIITTYRV